MHRISCIFLALIAPDEQRYQANQKSFPEESGRLPLICAQVLQEMSQ